MSVLKLATALLLATNALSQASPNKTPPPAPISCTLQVAPGTCTHAKGIFRSAQKTSNVMFAVEVVLTDRQAFQEENESLRTRFKHAMEINPSSAELSRLQLPSPFEHSILFELGAGGLVTKVVICVDLFDQVDVGQLEKGQGRVPAPVAFDKDSVATWATYVMGYVDGYYWGRAHSIAEHRENTLQK